MNPTNSSQQSDAANSPRIIWLSGPSSSGKIHSTKVLEERGWIRLEIDQFIQRQLDEFNIEINDPENAIDPLGEKVDPTNAKILKEKIWNFRTFKKKLRQR
ncbi:MAG: hypothetical protein H0X29_07075 [Parachlamydiaceae bacterium]|nr:hypothetical protein [Parachlamydiaceae bacterium]